MAYKDKDKQRQAQRDWVRQKRAGKGSTGDLMAGSTDTATLEYEIVADQKVYGRQAVKYQLKEAWDTRPMPDSPGDVPVPDNRGLYKRPDGTTYQIDACGTAHEKLPKGKSDKPANFGQPDCECRHCQQNRRAGDKHIINHGAYKPAEQLKANELNRVSMPGDIDYKAGTDVTAGLPEGVYAW